MIAGCGVVYRKVKQDLTKEYSPQWHYHVDQQWTIYEPTPVEFRGKLDDVLLLHKYFNEKAKVLFRRHQRQTRIFEIEWATPELAVYFLQTYVYTPIDKEIPLGIRVDDIGYIMVNQKILAHGRSRFRCTVEFKRGWNEIIIAVCNGGGHVRASVSPHLASRFKVASHREIQH